MEFLIPKKVLLENEEENNNTLFPYGVIFFFN